MPSIALSIKYTLVVDTAHITKALRTLGLFLGCSGFCLVLVTLGVIASRDAVSGSLHRQPLFLLSSVECRLFVLCRSSQDPRTAVDGEPPTEYKFWNPLVALPFLLAQYALCWYSFEGRRAAAQPADAANAQRLTANVLLRKVAPPSPPSPLSPV